MSRAASAAAALVLLVTGCGQQGRATGQPKVEPGVRGASTTAVHNDHGTVIKVYEVGRDIDPGVYTTRKVGCSAIATSAADYDLLADDSDPDGILATSVTVGALERIVLRQGEFFQVQDCAVWKREDGSGPRSPDPATVEGACTILVKDPLLDEVTTFLSEPRAELAGDSSGWGLQDRLMAVVASNLASRGALKTLSNSSGQLVDLIDDPAAYGDLDSRVTRASTRIRGVCGR